jgi:hypothetical protein
MTFDAAPGYLSADDCRLADLIDLVNSVRGAPAARPGGTPTSTKEIR